MTNKLREVSEVVEELLEEICIDDSKHYMWVKKELQNALTQHTNDKLRELLEKLKTKAVGDGQFYENFTVDLDEITTLLQAEITDTP